MQIPERARFGNALIRLSLQAKEPYRGFCDAGCLRGVCFHVRLRLRLRWTMPYEEHRLQREVQGEVLSPW